MSEIRDKTEAKIERRLKAMGTNTAYNRRWITGQILSIPELAIVDRNAELPKIHYGSYLSVKGGDKQIEGFELGLRRMKEEGWVKEISR